MTIRRRSLALALLAAATLAAPAPAHAQLLHRFFETVDVALRRADDFELAYDGDVAAGDDANSLGDLLAELTAPRAHGIASVGAFGDVGLLAELLGPAAPLPFHKLRARTSVNASPLFLNTLPYAVDVFADFVLDGGELSLVAAPGSFARWELQLVHAGLGDVFFSSGRYEVDAAGGRTLATHGTDIGAAIDAHGRVEIPLSFQTASLGRLAPGEQIYLAYRLEVEVGLSGASEFGRAVFSDPFGHSGQGSGNPLAATLRVVPAGPAVVPEPGTLALLGGGLLVLGGGAVRGRRARMRGGRDEPLAPAS